MTFKPGKEMEERVKELERQAAAAAKARSEPKRSARNCRRNRMTQWRTCPPKGCDRRRFLSKILIKAGDDWDSRSGGHSEPPIERQIGIGYTSRGLNCNVFPFGKSVALVARARLFKKLGVLCRSAWMSVERNLGEARMSFLRLLVVRLFSAKRHAYVVASRRNFRCVTCFWAVACALLVSTLGRLCDSGPIRSDPKRRTQEMMYTSEGLRMLLDEWESGHGSWISLTIRRLIGRTAASFS